MSSSRIQEEQEQEEAGQDGGWISWWKTHEVVLRWRVCLQEVMKDFPRSALNTVENIKVAVAASFPPSRYFLSTPTCASIQMLDCSPDGPMRLASLLLLLCLVDLGFTAFTSVTRDEVRQIVVAILHESFHYRVFGCLIRPSAYEASDPNLFISCIRIVFSQATALAGRGCPLTIEEFRVSLVRRRLMLTFGKCRSARGGLRHQESTDTSVSCANMGELQTYVGRCILLFQSKSTLALLLLLTMMKCIVFDGVN